MPLNFLNQPAQALYYSESETLKFVCFQESVAEHQMLVQKTWLAGIMQTGYDMREAQKDYFLQPTNNRLKAAKHRESGFDEILNKALRNGYIRPREKLTTLQQEMFKL